MMQDKIFFDSKDQIGAKRIPIKSKLEKKFDDGGSVGKIQVGDIGYLKRNKSKMVTVVKTTPRRIYYYLGSDPKMKSLYTENFIKSFTEVKGFGDKEPEKELVTIVDSEKEFFPLDLSLSTNRNTWNAVYQVGDIVYARKDMADFIGVDFSGKDNILKITKKFIEPSAKRPENPSGNMYSLKQVYGDRLFTFEGKDISDLIEYDTQKAVDQQQTTSTPDQETIDGDYTDIFKKYINNTFEKSELKEFNPLKDKNIRDLYREMYERIIPRVMSGADSLVNPDDRFVTLEDIDNIRAYLAINLSMPLITSELQEESGTTKEAIIDSIKKIAQVYDIFISVYMNRITVTKQDSVIYDERINDLKEQLLEYIRVKSLLSSENSPLIKNIDEKIEKLSTEFSASILYSPKGYYETYFLMNQNNIDDLKILNKSLSSTQALVNLNRWFSGSVVVDEYGVPLEVYHGSKNEGFTEFKFDVFPGVYFAQKKSYSEWFARLGPGDTLFSCYLNIKNPIDLTIFKLDMVKYEEFVLYVELKYKYKLQENKALKSLSDSRNGLWAWQYLRGGIDWLKQIIKDGVFDGLKFYENNPDDNSEGQQNSTIAWMVFKPNQIKSVNGNLIYSNNSEDIRFNKGGAL